MSHTHRAHCSMASARADDPLAEVKVGDPRPERHYQRGCGEASPRDYVCTRQQGHPGQHIATTPDRVVDVWPQDGAA